MLLLPLANLGSALPTRSLAAPSLRFGRHQLSDRDLADRDLVLCPTLGCMTPLRPGKVEGHLAKCPVLLEQRAREESGYYRCGANSGADEVDSSEEPPAVLTPDVAAELEARIREAHAATLGSQLMHTSVGLAPAPAEAEITAKRERERERHRQQRHVIAEQLAALGVLGHGHCLIELGAGNGELSLAVAEAYPEAVASDALILLDRSAKPKGKGKGSRLAADPALAAHFGSVSRVKLGIEDVDLGGLRDQLAPGRRLVVFAKHLCGAATDYALRAVAAACDSRAADGGPVAVVLGSCCHHRCTWAAYPARRWLSGSCRLTSSADFALLCRLSSRGTDAADASARADAGRRAKDLLDEGRRRYLRESCGFDEARLVTYVDGGVTPENVLVVGAFRSV